ncbi:hypothetical protein QCA50_004648 [Cerrena zonata]|uniref:Uncharacterized protein n=1 Tax=Cerrena zonata TaxID=2478898 RepID=A0AAW0GPT8_9APHY
MLHRRLSSSRLSSRSCLFPHHFASSPLITSSYHVRFNSSHRQVPPSTHVSSLPPSPPLFVKLDWRLSSSSDTQDAAPVVAVSSSDGRDAAFVGFANPDFAICPICCS